MSFWSQITNLFKGDAGSSKRVLNIYVLSRRCNEPIAGQVDLFNELSRTEDDGEYTFYTRKVLHTSGENRCFDQVEVQLWLDRNKQIARHEVAGGRWLDEAEYAAELIRFQTPPEENLPDKDLSEQDQTSG